LYGIDAAITADYFHWKYQENPNVDEPLGFVAIDQGKVVGFRGFFVTKWRIGNRDKTVRMLSSPDVCVHRRQYFRAVRRPLFVPLLAFTFCFWSCVGTKNHRGF